ncbi:MAG TPA: phage tail tape measure protein, partial [Candidatus Competibacteraceae bacterium]|nr:phage tail tape measure protein [Candidatus Competibacteraceae bacterium]
MAERNLALQLIISAKDEATALFGRIFGYLDDNTKVIAGKIRNAFTNVFGGGAASALELEAQLDRVAAKGGYTATEMVQLKAAAQQLGVQFGVTGVEAAHGMETLAAAGLSAADAIKTLPQVLALAKAEQISTDLAAERLIDSLSVMGLGFQEAGRMADVLAKGADITT